ncbi:MAG: hypothetical protein KAQ67_00395 [Gammaproteobacteria bacterium]|nr:hypothetical protein [Gammaproteobacteria bacterium]
MRIQQMIIGMMLLLSFGVSQADEGEARHFMGISSVSYSDDEMSGNSYQYGYDFSNLISIEMNVSTPDVVGTTATLLTVDTLASIMLRFNKRYESINTYFMIGASYLAFTTVLPVVESDYTGLSYGVGIELYGSKNTAITFTYTKSEYEEGTSIADLTTTSVGLVHHFDFAKPRSRY